ncbi:MAG: hypothetical protein ACI4SQ_04865, partial [Eubacterium sp.]
MTSIPMSTDYIDVKVKIGKVEFTNEKLQIDSIKISNGCYDGSAFGVGNVYIKNANITMNYRGGITKGLSMEIFFLHLGEWISFGQFIVKETPVINGEKLSVSLESAIGQTMSTSVVFETVLQEYTLRQIKTKLEEIIGKQIVFIPALTSEEEKSFLDGKSACFLKDIQNYVDQSAIDTGIAVRDMLSGLAILFGGNVYEDVRNRVVIKQKPKYTETENYVPSDYLDSNYKYSQETYSARVIGISFLPWSLSLYYPPNASGQICTVNYLGENRVENMIQYSPNAENYTAYDYTISCDWIGWTSDGATFDTHATPGGKYAKCFRQGDLVYKTCDMTFIGIDFGWNIAPGNLVKVQVSESEEPIEVLCGEITYEWDGGFTTSISCNCNIESNGSYLTQVSTQASAVAAQEGRKTNLDLNYANITLSNIKDSTISGSIFKDGAIKGSKIEDSTIEGSKIANSTITESNIVGGTITGASIADGSITDSVFEDGTINGSKIKESTISNSLIAESAITESKISNSAITNSKIKDSTLTGAKIKDATIGFEKVDTSFIEDLTADKVYIENLTARIGDFGFISADSADLKYATIETLEATDGKIDRLTSIAITTDNISASVAELGYLSADFAEITYAKIDFANVKGQVVGSSMIKDGAISDAKISNLSANKITGGTIDASKITVTNLNADNITVGTINGQRIGNKSLSLDKLAEEVPTKEYLDSVKENLQGQIDGAIETFTKTEIPTLNNSPADEWTDNDTRKKHIGDICYVVNPSSSADGYCYRFADLGTTETPNYSWELIKDSDVTKVLQDIIDINGEITGILEFDATISSWKTDTDAELSSLKTRTTSLETDMGAKVDTKTFNEVKQTIDENSSNITSLSETVNKKADGSTVTELSNTVNTIKQTADTNTSSIKNLTTEVDKKADGSTVTELSTKTSEIEQSLNGFKSEVSDTYATKKEVNDIEIGGRNLLKKSSMVNYIKNDFDITDKCKSGYGFMIPAGKNYSAGYYKNLNLEINTKYTISFIAWCDNGNSLLHNDLSPDTLPEKMFNLTTVPTRYRWTLSSSNADMNHCALRFFGMINSDTYITDIKFEKGNKATDWSPDPEDVEANAVKLSKSYIDQTAESINLEVAKKVGNNEIISKINQSAESVTISASKINLSGYVTVAGLKGSGTTEINGSNITTGTVSADRIDVSGIFAQDVTATGVITGATLKGTNAEIGEGKIGPLSISSDDGNLRFDLGDSYYLRIGNQTYGKGLTVFDNSGFTRTIYSSSGIWMRDDQDAGWDTIITPSRITIGEIIHCTSSDGCEINVPTTIKSLTVKNNDSKGKTVISNGLIGLDDTQGGTVRYFIDNTFGNLRIWDTKVGERLLFSSNSIFFKPK